MWTLTQTDDTLWYYLYTSQDNRSGSDKKLRGGASLQDNTAERGSKETQRKDEEEPQAVSDKQGSEMEAEVMLRNYFQLHVQLEDLYREWGAADPHFKKIADIFTGPCVFVNSLSSLLRNKTIVIRFLTDVLYVLCGISPGVRILRQDPTECLFSFICTSNNHISRIQGMVERLCQALGSPLCQLDQTSYYDFPTLSALAGAVTSPQIICADL